MAWAAEVITEMGPGCKRGSDNRRPRRELSGERVCETERLRILPREEETKDPLISLILEVLRPWWIQLSPREPVDMLVPGFHL